MVPCWNAEASHPLNAVAKSQSRTATSQSLAELLLLIDGLY